MSEVTVLKGQKIIGIRRVPSKDKTRIYTTYYCVRPWSAYEMHNGENTGTAVEEVQTSEDFPIQVGDTVKFFYGKAMGSYQPVTDYKLIESATFPEKTK